MFELVINGHFDAAHFLKGYNGKCAQVHGHTWKVEVSVRGRKLDQNGMLIDFSILKIKLKKITDCLDHILLNDREYFSKVNPTAENISQYIFNQYRESLRSYNNIQIYSVRVWESSTSAATYFSDEGQQ